MRAWPGAPCVRASPGRRIASPRVLMRAPLDGLRRARRPALLAFFAVFLSAFSPGLAAGLCSVPSTGGCGAGRCRRRGRGLRGSASPRLHFGFAAAGRSRLRFGDFLLAPFLLGLALDLFAPGARRARPAAALPLRAARSARRRARPSAPRRAPVPTASRFTSTRFLRTSTWIVRDLPVPSDFLIRWSAGASA